MNIDQYLLSSSKIADIPLVLDQLSLWIGRSIDIIDEQKAINQMHPDLVCFIDVSNVRDDTIILKLQLTLKDCLDPLIFLFEVPLQLYPFCSLNFTMGKNETNFDRTIIQKIIDNCSPPNISYGRLEAIANEMIKFAL